MYLRTPQRRNADGSVVRYVQLAHNRRVQGTTQAQVLLNLGRQDRLDPDGLRRLVASINRYLGEPDGDAAGADVRELAGDGLSVTGARPVGTVHLLDGLWRQLGVDSALRQVLGARRFTTDVERVLFALVANRAVDPSPSSPQPSGCGRTPPCRGWRAWMRTRRTGRWTCWSRPTPKPGCRRRCSSPSRTCSTSRSTCCSSTPRRRTSSATPNRPQPMRARRAGCGGTGTPRTPGRTCRRSSSGWRSPGRGYRCGAGSGRATPPTSRCCPRSKTGCGAGGWGGSSRWWTAGSPRSRIWTTCAAPAGTGSPGSGCVTATPPPKRRCPGRAGTGLSGTTCGSNRSGSRTARPPTGSGCAGSCATTRSRPNVTRPGEPTRWPGSPPSSTGSPPPGPGTRSA